LLSAVGPHKKKFRTDAFLWGFLAVQTYRDTTVNDERTDLDASRPGDGPIGRGGLPTGLTAKAEETRSPVQQHGVLVIPIKASRQITSGVAKWGERLWVRMLCRRLWWTIRMRANKGVCSVEIANNYVGFFAQMVWCLYILRYCERHRLVPDIRLTGDTYRDLERGSNWLYHYFDPSTQMTSGEVARRVRYTKKISAWGEMGPPAIGRMSLNEGACTLYKYLRPKPHIEKIVDDFWASMGVNGPVVGIHFRGTDHSEEAPRVPYEHCLNILENYLRIHDSTQAVFVASDEQAFVRFIKNSTRSAVLVYSHDDHYRSEDSGNVPVFRRALGEDGYEKGEDALVNALLLSRCSTLIRTTSCLAAWASVFNPTLRVILLNKPYDDKLWYPESEVIRKADTKYVPEIHN
jgi:hypothetical protein